MWSRVATRTAMRLCSASTPRRRAACIWFSSKTGRSSSTSLNFAGLSSILTALSRCLVYQRRVWCNTIKHPCSLINTTLLICLGKNSVLEMKKSSPSPSTKPSYKEEALRPHLSKIQMNSVSSSRGKKTVLMKVTRVLLPAHLPLKNLSLGERKQLNHKIN